MDAQQARYRTDGIGGIVEAALRWGLPASPLFLMVLMLLAHAPYAAPIVEPALFYLACMGGAMAGLLALMRMRLGARELRLACVAGCVALEVSWLVLLAAERGGSCPLLLAGAALAGLGSSALLVLWLWVGQTNDLMCEIGKLAAALGTSYVLYTLFSVVPHGGAISYFFPPLICVALWTKLAGEPAQEGQTAPDELVARPSAGQTLAVAGLLACFGAGFAALGFGGAQVEQGAGLLALALVACMLGQRGAGALRLVSVPAVTFSLCYAGLAGAGNAFAFFLMGCGALVVWLFLQHRFGHGAPHRTTTREVATRLAFIAACAAAGMALGHVCFAAAGIAETQRALVVVAVTALASFAWQLADMPPCEAPANAGAAAPRDEGAPATPAPQEPRQLESLYALSPRETQVAQLLCQNRSVQYISQALGMADSTTKTHVRHVYEKAGVHSRSEFQLQTERLSRAGQSC